MILAGLLLPYKLEITEYRGRFWAPELLEFKKMLHLIAVRIDQQVQYLSWYNRKIYMLWLIYASFILELRAGLLLRCHTPFFRTCSSISSWVLRLYSTWHASDGNQSTFKLYISHEL